MSSMPPLGGRYRLLDRVGHGGMSVVWRAYDQVLGRTVAVKLLAAPAFAAAEREMTRAEARTAAQLSHPHICQVYDYGESETESGELLPYIVMELLSGPTLMERLRAGPLPVPEALRVGAQVASALAAAHRHGLVHRDIKPANVMLTPAGPKLVDFGIAAVAGAPARAASTQELLGTPAYLAPERLLDGEVNAASDVYALGLVLYRMLSGAAPWPAETVTQMLEAHQYQEPAALPPVAGLPDAVAQLCQRCLAKHPSHRPTADELAERLSEAAGGPASPSRQERGELDDARPRPTLQHLGRLVLARQIGASRGMPRRHVMRTHRRRLVLVAAAMVTAALAVTGGLWLADTSDPRGPDVAAPDEPAVGVPASGPASSASPLVPASGPDGAPFPPERTGFPPARTDPPGVPGTRPPAAQDTAAPDPGSSEPPDDGPPDDGEPDPAEEVVETPGGTVLARCDHNRASVDPLELAPGFVVAEEIQGPGVVRAAIVLASDETEVRVDVRCKSGEPTSTVAVS